MSPSTRTRPSLIAGRVAEANEAGAARRCSFWSLAAVMAASDQEQYEPASPRATVPAAQPGPAERAHTG